MLCEVQTYSSILCQNRSSTHKSISCIIKCLGAPAFSDSVGLKANSSDHCDAFHAAIKDSLCSISSANPLLVHPRFLFVYVAMKLCFSFKPKPTLFTLPNRARASATRSSTRFSEALIASLSSDPSKVSQLLARSSHLPSFKAAL